MSSEEDQAMPHQFRPTLAAAAIVLAVTTGAALAQPGEVNVYSYREAKRNNFV